VVEEVVKDLAAENVAMANSTFRRSTSLWRFWKLGLSEAAASGLMQGGGWAAWPCPASAPRTRPRVFSRRR
jgi:hypothetical protein